MLVRGKRETEGSHVISLFPSSVCIRTLSRCWVWEKTYTTTVCGGCYTVFLLLFGNVTSVRVVEIRMICLSTWSRRVCDVGLLKWGRNVRVGLWYEVGAILWNFISPCFTLFSLRTSLKCNKAANGIVGPIHGNTASGQSYAPFCYLTGFLYYPSWKPTCVCVVVVWWGAIAGYLCTCMKKVSFRISASRTRAGPSIPFSFMCLFFPWLLSYIFFSLRGHL